MFIAKSADAPIDQKDIESNFDIVKGNEYILSLTYVQDKKLGFIECNSFKKFWEYIAWVSKENLPALIYIKGCEKKIKKKDESNQYTQPFIIGADCCFCIDTTDEENELKIYKMLVGIKETGYKNLLNKSILWGIDQILDNYDIVAFM